MVNNSHECARRAPRPRSAGISPVGMGGVGLAPPPPPYVILERTDCLPIPLRWDSFRAGLVFERMAPRGTTDALSELSASSEAQSITPQSQLMTPRTRQKNKASIPVVQTLQHLSHCTTPLPRARSAHRTATSRDTAASWMAGSSFLQQGESYSEQLNTAVGSAGQDIRIDEPSRYVHDIPNAGTKTTLARQALSLPGGRLCHGVCHGPAQLINMELARRRHCRRTSVGPDPYNASLLRTYPRATRAGRFVMGSDGRSPF